MVFVSARLRVDLLVPWTPKLQYSVRGLSQLRSFGTFPRQKYLGLPSTRTLCLGLLQGVPGVRCLPPSQGKSSRTSIPKHCCRTLSVG